MSSTYELALREVARQVQAIGTDRLFSDEIQVREMDLDDLIKVGGVTVRYDYSAIRERQEGTNSRDIFSYPCYVMIVGGFQLQMNERIPTALDLLQSVRRFFHNRRTMSAAETAGVNQLPTVCTAGPRMPAKVSDKKIHGITVWAHFLEPRSTDVFPA